METWGELFWDAWIRLRLWCRSLYRTYWPPQFKAWQICTVTGIVSVILTLFALNYQTAPLKLLAQNKPGASTKIPIRKTRTPVAKPLATTNDPFADADQSAAPVQDFAKDEFASSVDEMSPDGVAEGEVPDPGFEPIGARKFGKKTPAAVEMSTEEVALAEPTAEPVTEAAPQTELTLPPETSETPEMTEPEATTPATPGADLFQEPVVADAPRANAQPQPAVEEVEESAPLTTPLVATPDVEVPAATEPRIAPERHSKDYSRLGKHEDSEEDRHSVRDIRVAPAKELPAPVTHEPLLTPIRSKSHYSRFGKHEDSEEDRHSVRDIRPTRIDVVLIPGRDAAQPGDPESAAPESKSVPENETDPTSPVVPAQENPADNLTLPPTEAAPMEAAPLEMAPNPNERQPDQNLFAAEQPAMEPAATEPIDEGPSPPVLFAPEPTVVEMPLKKPHEYHGPVLSTDGVDHEAHQEEDVFSRTKRKRPTLDDLPPVATPPQAPPVEHVEPAEPTEPRITRRAPPRVIPDYDEGRPATDVTDGDDLDSRVVPMAVPDATRQRGPERITVPDSMPPVSPMDPVEPPDRQESSFAIPPTTQSVRPETAPRLVMAITGPKQAPVGTQVVWHFKIQNLGSAPATGIVVSDVLPPGLQHRLSPDLEYTIPRLDPGEERETNLTVQCVATGTITNRAVLRADGDLTTEAEIQIEVGGSSAPNPNSAVRSPLTVTHHGPERWLVDSTGQFLVTVTNTSSERQRNVTITQSYPSGTNLVHATVGHRVDQTNRTVTWTIPDFAPGASYVLETELHSIAKGPGTSIVRVKVGDAIVTEDRWTAISFGVDGRP